MPRIRGVKVPQKASPTGGGPTPRVPRHIRTSSSDSDPLHQRLLTEGTPRIVDRRSPKGSQSDPVIHQKKKLGTRITDLETQLVQAQQELKSLKHQLSSAEAAKKQAQLQLNNNKGVKKPTLVKKAVRREKLAPVTKIPSNNSRDSPDNDETDVFEVPVEKMLVESSSKEAQSELSEEAEKPSSCDEVGSKNEEVEQFKGMVEEKEKQKQLVMEKNERLKKELEKAKSEVVEAQSKEEEVRGKVKQVEEELEESKENEGKLKDKLLEVLAGKESLEKEMKKMKVQTEQWRKAADAAAAVLAGGNNSRISDRCASMDNHFINGMFEPPMDGFVGYLGLAEAGDDGEEGFGRERKRSSGIRMLGDLWRKKGHK